MADWLPLREIEQLYGAVKLAPRRGIAHSLHDEDLGDAAAVRSAGVATRPRSSRRARRRCGRVSVRGGGQSGNGNGNGYHGMATPHTPRRSPRHPRRDVAAVAVRAPISSATSRAPAAKKT